MSARTAMTADAVCGGLGYLGSRSIPPLGPKNTASWHIRGGAGQTYSASETRWS
ncbi:hypothetical protein KIPE111705_21310 [Kibdelosporangium persicum]